jgi:hypothetical protein
MQPTPREREQTRNYFSDWVCRRRIPAARWTRTAIASHTNQLDNGPRENTKVSVQPRLDARLHSANAYTDTTAGPIRADTKAPNFWAVSPAHSRPCETVFPAAWRALTVQSRAGSVNTAIAVVRDSGISFSLCCDF